MKAYKMKISLLSTNRDCWIVVRSNLSCNQSTSKLYFNQFSFLCWWSAGDQLVISTAHANYWDANLKNDRHWEGRQFKPSPPEKKKKKNFLLNRTPPVQQQNLSLIFLIIPRKCQNRPKEIKRLSCFCCIWAIWWPVQEYERFCLHPGDSQVRDGP